MEPAVHREGKTCYIFPDHFDRLGIILTLRQAYNLPLSAIRNLLEHFPAEHRNLIMERKFEIDELLDLAQMLKNGYQIKDLIMAKACDVLLQDLMSSSQTISAALEPGDTMRRLQEKLILGRPSPAPRVRPCAARSAGRASAAHRPRTAGITDGITEQAGNTRVIPRYYQILLEK
jgi:hypothetical protein